MDSPRRLTSQPDPILARLEGTFFPDGLTLEDRVRLAVREAKAELDPRYVKILRKLPPGRRLSLAFELWDLARETFYKLGLRLGLSPKEAMRYAARRLLENDL